MTTRRENHAYKASGLEGVTLIGVKVSRCEHCGEWEASIPRIEGLHQAIAMALVHKPAPLTGAEIRFLRKHLGWSGIDFAMHVGVTAETVSRWEQNRLRMASTADRLLRMLIVREEPAGRYPLARLKEIGKERELPLEVRLKIQRGGWAAA